MVLFRIDKITRFYKDFYSWEVPWQDVTIVYGGWYWKFLKRINPGIIAGAWLLRKPWELHLDPRLEGDIHFERVIVRELMHCKQREADFSFIIKYSIELILNGYKNCSYELEAEKAEKEYTILQGGS